MVDIDIAYRRGCAYSGLNGHLNRGVSGESGQGVVVKDAFKAGEGKGYTTEKLINIKRQSNKVIKRAMLPIKCVALNCIKQADDRNDTEKLSLRSVETKPRPYSVSEERSTISKSGGSA